MSDTATEPEADPQVEIEFGLWWPAADPDRLRDLAAAWDAMAVALDAGSDGLGTQRDAVTGANEGDAIDAFARYIDGWTTSHLPDAADQCRELAAASREFAGAVDEARDTIRQLAIEIAASIAIGVGLAILTAGVSAGAAAGITAAAVARAGIVATSLAARVVAILSRVVVFAGVGAVESGATNLVIQTGRNAITNPNHDPLAGYDLDELAVSTAAGGVLGGGFGGIRSTPLIRGAEPAVDATRSGITGLTRVGSAATKIDPHHAFPNLVDNFAVGGTRFLIPRRVPGGAVARLQDELVQVSGSLNGREGIFEWIIRNGQVVHRRFIPRGLVNGVPNQLPPPPVPRVP